MTVQTSILIEIERRLMNAQPTIANASNAAFIDNHIDPILEMLKDALGRSTTDWQSIETAPKDRMFLGLRGRHPQDGSAAEVFVGKCWYEPHSDPREGNTEWVTGDAYSTRPGTPERDVELAQRGKATLYSVVQLTHWMPLPSPPAAP